MWGLPGNADRDILPVVSDCLLMLDEHCKSSIQFKNSRVVCAYSSLAIGLLCQLENDLDYMLDISDVERGNMYISCVQTFYESLVNAELRLKVHLILEAIVVPDRVMTLDGFDLQEIIEFINYFCSS